VPINDAPNMSIATGTELRDIDQLWHSPLPPISHQRRQAFRPVDNLVNHCYDQLNQAIFDGQLVRPDIYLGQRRLCWGYCRGIYPTMKCQIYLSDKYFCAQWFIAILAHEMCHQYQWQIVGQRRIEQSRFPVLNHGPGFFEKRPALKQIGIPLRKSFCSSRWFQTQNFAHM
jgi:hypothetical protein